MLDDLPAELVDYIAGFVDYRDLVSLKLTCKRLKIQVDSVRVKRLNVFVDALPYTNRLFHLDEPTKDAESLVSSPDNVLSSAFHDRFKHLKRLTVQQKFRSHCSFVLERDLNCFEHLEHLELRAKDINDGGRLRLKELRILLIETEKEARFVADCERLSAIHFVGAQPEIVYQASLKHASFVHFDLRAFVRFCKMCPNLIRLTLTTDSSHLFHANLLRPSRDQYLVLHEIGDDRMLGSPIDKKELKCLERLEVDLDYYVDQPFEHLRKCVRASTLLDRASCPQFCEAGYDVYCKLSIYFGSQNLIADEFDELLEVMHDQFKPSEDPRIKRLRLYDLDYFDLLKYQGPMSGLIPGLRFLTLNEKVDLGREQPIYKLANLRDLLIRENVLDETVLNEFTRRFSYLTVLTLSWCEIRNEQLDLLPNHSVHLLLLKECTCFDLSFVKSFKNLKTLFLFDTTLSNNFWSFLAARPKYLSLVVHAELGAIRFSRSPELIFLSPEKASTVEEMVQNSREDLASDHIRFENLEALIEYANQIAS